MTQILMLQTIKQTMIQVVLNFENSNLVIVSSLALRISNLFPMTYTKMFLKKQGLAHL